MKKLVLLFSILVSTYTHSLKIDNFRVYINDEKSEVFHRKNVQFDEWIKVSIASSQILKCNYRILLVFTNIKSNKKAILTEKEYLKSLAKLQSFTDERVFLYVLGLEKEDIELRNRILSISSNDFVKQKLKESQFYYALIDGNRNIIGQGNDVINAENLYRYTLSNACKEYKGE